MGGGYFGNYKEINSISTYGEAPQLVLVERETYIPRGFSIGGYSARNKSLNFIAMDAKRFGDGESPIY